MATIRLPDKVEPGVGVEVQLAPRGRFPQIVDGSEVEQILDDASIGSLVSTFDGKVLVDADHESETGGGTKAEAWVTKVFDDPKRGLVGVFEFTDIGADDVNNARYRFISPAWTLDDDGRPVKLVSVGMTNKPNLPVAPVLNSRVAGIVNSIEPGDGTAVVTADDGHGEATGGKTEAETSAITETTTQKEGNPEMDEFIKQLKAKLGLGEDATLEDLGNAVDAVVARCETAASVNEALGLDQACTNEETMQALNAVLDQCGELQAANAEMESARLNAEAEQFVADNADEELFAEDEEKEALKQEYLEDPEKAKRTVENARRLRDRLALNAQTKRQTATRAAINVQTAKKPVVVNAIQQGLAACNGDPEKENAFLRSIKQ